jgi:hypothetical protein
MDYVWCGFMQIVEILMLEGNGDCIIESESRGQPVIAGIAQLIPAERHNIN